MACLNCRFGNRGCFTDFHLELLILVKNIQEFVSVNMFIEQIDNNPMNELTLTSFRIRHKCLRHHFLQNCVSPYVTKNCNFSQMVEINKFCYAAFQESGTFL